MAAENQQENSNEEAMAKKAEEEQQIELKTAIEPVLPDSHPLYNSWTLWFYRNDKAKKWEECLKSVASFSSVEAFWRVYNHITGPSKLPFGCDYAIFKKGIKPMWEDDQNRNGGRWLINYQRNSKAELDQSWLQVEETETFNGLEVVKHPLHCSWTLWFYQNDKTKNWVDCQMKVATFESVEDFWGVYNHMLCASKLSHGCDYSIFKTGIKPMWEDKKNKHGGRWLINFSRNSTKGIVDQAWLEVMLLLIGEGFGDDGDEVCGAVVSIRNKGDKIGIWTRDFNNSVACTNIGKLLKERLRIERQGMGYQSHEDASSRANSRAKDLYTV